MPEFDLRYSFESGLEDWVPAGTDLGAPAPTWTIESSTEQASVGNRSARIALDNTNGRAKVWLERGFDVEPGRAYDIEISFDFGRSAASDEPPWRIVAGAHTEPPRSAAELVVQDATTGAAAPGGFAWAEKRYTVRASANAEGRIHVVLGLWGTEPSARTYYLDDVRLLFTRVSAGG